LAPSIRGAFAGPSFARFRIKTAGTPLPTGFAVDSEVENHPLTLVVPAANQGFGDAPLPYPVTLANNGARHTTGALFLGGTVDGEPDGTNSAAANSDDEQIFSSSSVVAGENFLSLNIPANPTASTTGAWFRVSTAGYRTRGTS